MTGNDCSAGRTGIVATCGKPARAFRELGWCEAAKLPERGPGQQDAGRVPFEGGSRFSGVRGGIGSGKFA